MQVIQIKDCLDGVTRPDNGFVGHFVTKTDGQSIAVNECGDIITNKGATGAVKVKLPDAKHGRHVRAMKIVPGQDVWLTATGGAKIDGGTANKSIKNTTNETGKLTLVSDGTDWYTWASVGTWAADNS